jgi:oligoribonuclease (3'-5' exoribonuclease)
MQDKQKSSVLDQIKEAELIKKKYLLLKSIQRIKELCAIVIETKEEINIALKMMGVEKDEAKSLIDFLNEMEEVKMTDKKREKLVKKVEDSLKEEKKKISEDFIKSLENTPSYNFSTSAPFIGTGNYMDYKNIYNSKMLDSGNTITLCSAGKSIDLKV